MALSNKRDNMSRIYIIAEAGVNHNGSLEIAKKMVDAVREAGADAIKFQTFKAENIVTQNASRAEYQVKNTGEDASQYSMLKKLELSYDDFRELKAYCDDSGIEFLSTPFDLESIDFLQELGIRFLKIPSGEITNFPYLRKIGQTGMPVIMSTGMSTLEEVGDAIGVLREYGSNEISLLHCTTEYPAPLDSVNLKAMQTMAEAFNLPVGYSDHTSGIAVSVAAVAMGAVIIEKHFTIDRNMEGPDHKASLELDELKAMVKSIRDVEMAMGTGEKTPAESECANADVARKSIVAKTCIKAGELLTEDNITVKRPGTGISPMKWNSVLGKIAPCDFKADDLIWV